MRYLTELICQLYRLTDHHKLTAATFKNLADIKLVGVRLENGNFPTIRASPNSQSRFLISVCSSMKGKG